MNIVRRERLRCLTELLQWTQAQVHNFWIEEEAAFERRQPASQGTDMGQRSKDAIESLESAVADIQTAIEHIQSAAAVADDVDPPTITCFDRRI